MDYISLEIHYTPLSEAASDLMAAFLADMGYESFVSNTFGLTAYIQADNYSEKSVRDMLDDFPMPIEYSLSSELIKSQDWNSEWEKNYFQPIMIGDNCCVHSSFHKDVPDTKYDIVIDPKMAFGTGHHATTSMMLRHLLDLDIANKNVIDMGAGTGILSILAKMRGAKNVSGIEIDPDAAENARENVELNNVEVEILTGDASKLDSLEPADIFIANINRNVILADLKHYEKSLKKGATMLLSGFYEDDIPLLERALNLYGLNIESKLVEPDNWASLRVKKG